MVGTLTLLLGYAPGVGKTTRLLMAGERLRAWGRQVVVGGLAAHDRPKMSRDRPLELLPMKEATVHEHPLSWMDVESLLARAPEVVLVDDLATLNPPGQESLYRWQEVERLLAAGIEVVGTLDVFHLPHAARRLEPYLVTPIREGIPRLFWQQAVAVELVDRCPEALCQDYQAGLLPPHGLPAWERERFYEPRLLASLRQIALTEVLDAAKRSASAGGLPEKRPGGVMVLLTPVVTNPLTLLRRGAELADCYGVPWFAAFLESLPGAHASSSPPVPEREAKLVALTRELQGEPVYLQSPASWDAVVTFATSRGVSRVVTAWATRGGWRHRWGRSPLQRLVEAGDGLEIVVLPLHGEYLS